MVGNKAVRACIFQSIAFHDVVADVLHAELEVVGPVPFVVPRIEVSEIITEPWSWVQPNGSVSHTSVPVWSPCGWTRRDALTALELGRKAPLEVTPYVFPPFPLFIPAEHLEAADAPELTRQLIALAGRWLPIDMGVDVGTLGGCRGRTSRRSGGRGPHTLLCGRARARRHGVPVAAGDAMRRSYRARVVCIAAADCVP